MKISVAGSLVLIAVFASTIRPSTKHLSQANSAQDEAVKLSKTGANHKLLGQLAGIWTLTGRHISPDTGATMVEFKGRLVRRGMWEGRYFIAETTGDKLVMPWSNGREIAAEDMTMEAYDNAKGKFVSALIDNHFDTGILIFEGSYDAATKTISYLSETEDLPGVKAKYWKTVRFVDSNHYVEEFYTEDKGRKVRSTEISYTRLAAPAPS